MYIKGALCFILLIVSVTSEFTWWTDNSCNAKFGDNGETLDKMMGEVFETYKWTEDRMSQSEEEQPEAYGTFQLMFHYEPTAVWAWFVPFMYIVSTLGKFTKEPISDERGRKASEIRIYCDNDDRMTLAEDDETLYTDLPLNTPLNSQRIASQQEWDDGINKVRSIGTPGCKQNFPGGNFVMANTHGAGLKYGSDPEENIWRVSISICDAWFDHAHRINLWEHIYALGLPPYPTGMLIENLQFIGSQVIGHEVMHHTRFARLDVENGYSWLGMMSLVAYNAWLNAETNSVFGGLMRMLDSGAKLEVIDGDHGEMVATGNILFNQRIPARVPYVAPEHMKRDSNPDILSS